MVRTRVRLIIAMLFVSVLASACASTLPEAAKKALDAKAGTTIEVVSAKKAKDPNFRGPWAGSFDEAWCVANEAQYSPQTGGRWQFTHAILLRHQLLWEVYAGFDLMDMTDFPTKDEFLAAGCDNW